MNSEQLEIIYGKNAVIEALSAGTREINKILISKNLQKFVLQPLLCYKG